MLTLLETQGKQKDIALNTTSMRITHEGRGQEEEEAWPGKKTGNKHKQEKWWEKQSNPYLVGDREKILLASKNLSFPFPPPTY